jgi:hypothetical protein
MLRTKLLNKITRHARPSTEEDASLYPERIAPGLSEMCQTSDNDLSYEDALIDTQARLFYHRELGQAGAPEPTVTLSALFSRIEKAQQQTDSIETIADPAPRVTSERPSILPVLRQKLAGTFVTRFAPGGVALLLLLSMLGTDIAMLLRNDPPSERSVGIPGESDALAPQPVRRRPSSINSLPARTTPDLLGNVPSSAAQLHPVELGMDPADREEWARLYPQFFDLVRRTDFGPE